MSDKSKIEWTDATWNPLRARRRDTMKVGWHCEKVSPECDHCYAAAMNKRTDPKGLIGIGTGLNYAADSSAKVDTFLDENTLLQPLKWKRPRKIFVCSMTDLFGEWVPDEMILRILSVASQCPEHSFQLLTKRPERALRILGAPNIEDAVDKAARLNGWCHANASGRFPLPNVWLGVTAGNQEQADKRIPLLLQTPAAVRFVSCEPLLGPVDLRLVRYDANYVGSVLHGFPVLGGSEKLDWVIAGGESGQKARPMRIEWAESLRDQCNSAGTAFFMKQLGVSPIWAGAKALPIEPSRGKNDNAEEWPVELRVREFPNVAK